MSSELEALIVRLAKENPHWGYDKIQGKLLKLGYKLCTSSVRNILKQHRVTPARERSSGSWRSFLGYYKDQILACDFFTVETIWLKPSMCCSSSNWELDVSVCQDAQPLPTQPGLHSRLANWSGI